MSIYFEEKSRTFHLTNGMISYIIKVLRNDHLGQLYFGKAVDHREDFDYLVEIVQRSMTIYAYPGDMKFAIEHLKQEYPAYGSGDYRPCYERRHQSSFRTEQRRCEQQAS